MEKSISDAVSFIVLLQYIYAGVVLAFIGGLLGLLYRKDAPLGPNVILIKREA